MKEMLKELWSMWGCSTCSKAACLQLQVHDVHRQGTSTLLSSKQIFTSFHPASTSMLADIGRLMGFCNVSAKLNSLQLLGQGHEVSPHMTMPNPNGQFGSLIVCLPGQHAGALKAKSHPPVKLVP